MHGSVVPFNYDFSKAFSTYIFTKKIALKMEVVPNIRVFVNIVYCQHKKYNDDIRKR